jgi:hypothetical protein
LFISALSIAEIWRGVLEKPAGRKRRELQYSFWGRLMNDGIRSGRPRDPFDMIVAAKAEANRCIIVTDNERHLAGLNFINPMRSH